MTQVGGDYLAQFGPQGGLSLRIAQAGTVVYQQGFGGLTSQSVMPIMSASKTLCAAVILALHDEGVLDIDQSLGLYLPEWGTPTLAAITFRMCLTHTSGVVSVDPVLFQSGITMRQAAQQIAQLPLVHAPGAAFAYGQVAMQAAAAAAEVASGRSWAQLFQQKIAAPLQLTATAFDAFGPHANPPVAFGARSSAEEYAVFLEMLRLGGIAPHAPAVRVLSQALVDEMVRDQVGSLPVLSTGSLTGATYGIGVWIDRRDAAGTADLVSHPGAYGFTGWIDYTRQAVGVFATNNWYPAIANYIDRCWAACDESLLPVGVGCYGAASPGCLSPAWMSASRPPQTGRTDFQITASRAPASAIGGLHLGAVDPLGFAIADLQSYLLPTASTFALIASDAQGQIQVPLSLAQAPPGIVFAAQCYWLTPDPCTAIGVQASHPLRLTTLP